MVSDQAFYNYSLVFYFIITLPIITHLRNRATPYGKHRQSGGGTTIPAPLAWFIMESPTLWHTLLLFPMGQNYSSPKAQILILPFLFHYFHRTVIYPLRLSVKARHRKATGGGFPLSIAMMGFLFNVFNSYLQARWVSHYADYDGDIWFWWRFAGGLAVFIMGMAVNVEADSALLRLKNEGEGGYKIPRGGLFEFVSCPNYFGEMMEWLGWALMTWSWAGFGFFWYTCANLVPRAAAHHKWYLEKFRDDYPKQRKALIPFLY